MSFAPPSLHLFSLTTDLLAHTSTFLPLTDIFLCTSLCRSFHSLFDSDKVWRPRLLNAHAIQSTIQLIGEEEREEEEEQEGKEGEDEEEIKDEEMKDESLSPPLPPPLPPPSSSFPSLLLAAELCLSHYSSLPSASLHHDYRQAPSPYSIPSLLSILPSSSSPPTFHCRIVQCRSETQNFIDCRSFILSPSPLPPHWTVSHMGPRFSGTLVLNSSENIHTLTSPALPPTSPSCKQRYLSLLSCSTHKQNGCFRVLKPEGMRPSPPPPPHWYSQNLRDAVVEGSPAPALPVSPFPPHSTLPLCSQCLSVLDTAIQSFCDIWRRKYRMPPLQLTTILRVNLTDFDTQFRQYEDEAEYRRLTMRFEGNGQWKVIRLYEQDSGVYAIAAPPNCPWNNPAPPSGERLRWAGHDHCLSRFPISPYRHGLYTCNECAASESGEVWHCSLCQFDLCLRCREGEGGPERQAVQQYWANQATHQPQQQPAPRAVRAPLVRELRQADRLGVMAWTGFAAGGQQQHINEQAVRVVDEAEVGEGERMRRE